MVRHTPLIVTIECSDSETIGKIRCRKDKVELAGRLSRMTKSGAVGRDVQAVLGQLVRPGKCLSSVGCDRAATDQTLFLKAAEDGGVPDSIPLVAVLAIAALGA